MLFIKCVMSTFYSVSRICSVLKHSHHTRWTNATEQKWLWGLSSAVREPWERLCFSEPAHAWRSPLLALQFSCAAALKSVHFPLCGCQWKQLLPPPVLFLHGSPSNVHTHTHTQICTGEIEYRRKQLYKWSTNWSKMTLIQIGGSDCIFKRLSSSMLAWTYSRDQLHNWDYHLLLPTSCTLPLSYNMIPTYRGLATTRPLDPCEHGSHMKAAIPKHKR